MPVRANAAERRIKVFVGEEAVVLICRQPSAEEVEKFLRARVKMERNKPVLRRFPAAVKFMRSILTDIENAEWVDRKGRALPLNKETALDDAERSFQSGALGLAVHDWRDLVNPTWLASAAAVFEENEAEEDPEAPLPSS